MKIALTLVTMEYHDASAVLASLGPCAPFGGETRGHTYYLTVVALGSPATVRKRMVRAHRCITQEVTS